MKSVGLKVNKKNGGCLPYDCKLYRRYCMVKNKTSNGWILDPKIYSYVSYDNPNDVLFAVALVSRHLLHSWSDSQSLPSESDRFIAVQNEELFSIEDSLINSDDEWVMLPDGIP